MGLANPISPPAHHPPSELEAHLGKIFQTTLLFSTQRSDLHSSAFSLSPLNIAQGEMFWMVGVWM